MTPTQVAAGLKQLGWHCRNGAEFTHAVEDFQRGYNLGQPLTVDGVAGSYTQQALQVSLARRAAGKPTASAHFSFSEWACQCGGTLPGCRVICVHRGLLAGLEVYRANLGTSLSIFSGYRCPERNKAVGGAADSQHLYGAAADVGYAQSDVAVARERVFSGIGRSHRTHLVRHVDVRHLSGHNSTGGTPDRPTIWDYAS